MEQFEYEIVDYANQLWKEYDDVFRNNNIIVNEYPKIIDIHSNYREFTFVLWNDNRKDILVIEFPTFIQGKPFCTLEQAKEWIKSDITEFVESDV